MEKHELIAIIAPAVRTLLWQSGMMPTVSFQEAFCGKKEGCLEVSIDSSDTSQQIIANLTQALAAKSMKLRQKPKPTSSAANMVRIGPWLSQ